eukprot:TRINITY_DN4470_c0_g1_i1.p1 TRINITY_DN4470_c0_g1~~TRINITY_DN4470_c0_g1_i1.p1  ORF type:complete len:108 (-),score=5.66 TRINITY_DN4470_c0_g1_i1:290-613(-)
MQQFQSRNRPARDMQLLVVCNLCLCNLTGIITFSYTVFLIKVAQEIYLQQSLASEIVVANKFTRMFACTSQQDFDNEFIFFTENLTFCQETIFIGLSGFGNETNLSS